MVEFIFYYVGKSVKKIVPSKIVRYMRDVIMVADNDGNIAKYVLAKDTTPQKRTTRKLTTRTPIPRPNLTKTKKPISKADEAAKKMKPCVVKLQSMTPARLRKVQASVKRQYRLKVVKEKILSLSCKEF